MGVLIACGRLLFHLSSLVLCKHGLLISVKNNRLQAMHKGYLSLISLDLLLVEHGGCISSIHNTLKREMAPFLWFLKWCITFFNVRFTQSYPVSGLLCHVFCSCYVEVGTHLTPPEHNPTVLPLRPVPWVFPLLPQGIPADSGA